MMKAMAAAAALMLIAGQSAAATSDLTAAAAPSAHARTVNYCDTRQMKPGAGDRIRLHAANRCAVVITQGGTPYIPNRRLLGALALGVIGFGIYLGTKSSRPASP